MFETLYADLAAQLEPGVPRSWSRLVRVFFLSPGYGLLRRHRVAHWCTRYKLLRPVAKLLWYLGIYFNASYVSPTAAIGKGLSLPHAVGIVIGEGAVIGENVTLYQHVTLGRRNEQTHDYPSIGDGVTIYAGAVVAGGISVGEGSVVGANVVLVKPVPPRSKVFVPLPVVKEAQ